MKYSSSVTVKQFSWDYVGKAISHMVFPDCIPESCHKVRELAPQRRRPSALGDAAAADRADSLFGRGSRAGPSSSSPHSDCPRLSGGRTASDSASRLMWITAPPPTKMVPMLGCVLSASICVELFYSDCSWTSLDTCFFPFLYFTRPIFSLSFLINHKTGICKWQVPFFRYFRYSFKPFQVWTRAQIHGASMANIASRCVYRVAHIARLGCLVFWKVVITWAARQYVWARRGPGLWKTEELISCRKMAASIQHRVWFVNDSNYFKKR